MLHLLRRLRCSLDAALGFLVPLQVEPFGLFLALGLLLGVGLSARLGARGGFERQLGAEGLFGALVGALLGARTLYLVGARAPVSAALGFALGEGGLSGYGAWIGASLGGWLSCRAYFRRRGGRDRVRATQAWFDVAALGAVLVIAITRLGCSLQGCDFGRALPARAPAWLARLGTFPRSVGGVSIPVWVEQVSRGELGRDSASTLPVHPTALYEAFGALILLAVLFVRRRSQRYHGELFLCAAVGYAWLRLLTESARGDLDRGSYLGVSMSQWCALVSAPLALLALFAQRPRLQRDERST